MTLMRSFDFHSTMCWKAAAKVLASLAELCLQSATRQPCTVQAPASHTTNSTPVEEGEVAVLEILLGVELAKGSWNMVTGSMARACLQADCFFSLVRGAVPSACNAGSHGLNS